jgi:hypothetical protein
MQIFVSSLDSKLWKQTNENSVIIIIIIIRSTTSLCIYGLLYHLLYVYLYDRWFPEPRARVKAGYRTCPNNVALPSCPRLASNGIVKIQLGWNNLSLQRGLLCSHLCAHKNENAPVSRYTISQKLTICDTKHTRETETELNGSGWSVS